MGFNDRMAFNFTQMDFNGLLPFKMFYAYSTICKYFFNQFILFLSGWITASSVRWSTAGREPKNDSSKKWPKSPKIIPRKNAQKPKNDSYFSKFMLDSFTSREEATPRMGWFSNIQSHQIVVIFLQFWGNIWPRNEQMRKNSSPTKFMVVSFTFTRMYYIII